MVNVNGFYDFVYMFFVLFCFNNVVVLILFVCYDFLGLFDVFEKGIERERGKKEREIIWNWVGKGIWRNLEMEKNMVRIYCI